MDALVLASPDAAVAAVPHILGFTPESSLVLIWSADDRILLTQRMDLAGETGRAWITEAARHGLAAGASAVVLLAFRPRGLEADLPGLRAVDALERRLADRGVDVLDALLVDAGRWWSYRCDDACCPPEGRSVDETVAAEVNAAFVLQGSAPFASRASLAASLRSAGEAPVTAVPRPLDVPVEVWRDAVLDGPIARLLGDEPLPEDDVPVILGALADVRVRDVTLWHLARHEDARRLLGRLAPLLRVADGQSRAPIATVTALGAWLCGDGARAGIAVDLALEADPGYSLALLVECSLRAGMPPGAWVGVMNAISLETCRHGDGAPERASVAAEAGDAASIGAGESSGTAVVS